ncbi:hypothetical protein BTJ49_15370 [Oleiagrimonas sp. MCCC 1A03011]|nr:hypothetical protein BTJ49_15370 [Oleiagrimonas sp. MCCC 1A03011]
MVSEPVGLRVQLCVSKRLIFIDQYRIYSASSLTDSLRSVVRLRRAEMAYERGGDFLEDARKSPPRSSAEYVIQDIFRFLAH